MVTSAFLTVAVAAEFRVDTAQEAADYRNGDFEKLSGELSPILSPGTACSRTDSMQAWKYLAVIYAAAPATREKGRYCMLRLLDLDSNADLLDLFASEEVNDLFQRARREHVLTEESAPPLTQPDSPSVASASHPDSASADTGTVALEDIRPRQWVVSALAAAAVAGMTWYTWENYPERGKIYHVSEP